MEVWGVSKGVWGLEARKSMGGSKPIAMAMMSRNSDVPWIISTYLLGAHPPPWLVEKTFPKQIQTVRTRSGEQVSQWRFLELPNRHIIWEFRVTLFVEIEMQEKCEGRGLVMKKLSFVPASRPLWVYPAL